MSVKPIPEGYHTVTPFLIVKDAAKLIDFLRDAFDAKENSRFDLPDGSVAHAELKIGDSIIVLGEASDAFPAISSFIYLYVEDIDATFQRAVKAGAESVKEPSDQFYGDRSGIVKDTFDNKWWIATHIEDVSPEEVKKRAESYSQQAQTA
jgi:PhnB protein